MNILQILCLPTQCDTITPHFMNLALVIPRALAFECNYVDIIVRVCSIQLLKRNHKFAAFLRLYKRFFTLIYGQVRNNLHKSYKIAIMSPT